MYLNSPYFYDDTIDTTSDNSLGDEPIDLYEIIRQRYERGSTISTSNRAIEEWPPLFGELLLASAALDRLLHHAHVIEMEDNTCRTRPRPSRRRASGRVHVGSSRSSARWSPSDQTPLAARCEPRCRCPEVSR
jgi:hypothetical protein